MNPRVGTVADAAWLAASGMNKGANFIHVVWQRAKAYTSSRGFLNRSAQFVVIALCALALKQYYSTASPNDLRWILGPTTALVELVAGIRFDFESQAGYISSDRSFLIAGSCAGVNFLIAAFSMLSLRKLCRDWSRTESVCRTSTAGSSWLFIPYAALVAYLATLVVNAVRISIAIWLLKSPLGISWLSANQLHRCEGILVYFGFLLLLFVVSEKMSFDKPAPVVSQNRLHGFSKSPIAIWRLCFVPLLIYYATALGVPLVNRVYRPEIAATDFWRHSLFVLLIPLLLILPLAAFCTVRIIHRLHRCHRLKAQPQRV